MYPPCAIVGLREMVNKTQDSSSMPFWNSQSNGEAATSKQLNEYIQIMTDIVEIKQIPRQKITGFLLKRWIRKGLFGQGLFMRPQGEMEHALNRGEERLVKTREGCVLGHC